MTLDQVLDKAAREIDIILERLVDENALHMIACGVEDDLMQDALAFQRELIAAWRAETLQQIREQLLDPSGWHRDPE
jgi:hypothetical protein